MAILRPSHLLEQAELLLQNRTSLGIVRQVDRRRAISAAYYGVFHFVLTALADQFVGAKERNSPLYPLAYRSVDHAKLEALCKALTGTNISEKYAKFLPESGIGDNLKQFAGLLLELKTKRVDADYNPGHWIKIADARQAIVAARSAMEGFKRSSGPRKRAFLTLLAFPPR